MATRFKCTQIGTAGGDTFSLYIDDADFVGTATDICLQRDSLKIAYEGSTATRYTPVIPSSCEFSMIIENATHEALITDLAAAQEGRFTVKITQGLTGSESLYWPGYVLPDIARLEDLNYPFRLTIKATDGLARLRGIDYSDGTVPFGEKSFVQHLVDCLTQDGLSALYFTTSDVFIRTLVEWIESGHGTPATSKCPTAFTRVRGDVWAKRKEGNKWEFQSCYDVVSSICAHWNAQLIFSQGGYRFQQISVRRNNFFTERRFSRTGALLSSGPNVAYPKTIDATVDGFKISYPTNTFFPALKSAKVVYDHKTFKNYLDGQSFRWYKTGVNDTLVFTDVGFDADSFIKISGRFFVKASNPSTTPWRIVFSLVLTAGSYKLRSLTSVPVPAINIIQREPPVWEIGPSTYHVTTDFIFTTSFEGEVFFSAWTPVPPSGVDEFSIDFEDFGAFDPNGNSVIYTLEDWAFKDLVLTIEGLQSEDNAIAATEYVASNPTLGNSKVETFNAIFGHAVKPWTPSKLRVSSNGTTWVDTTATWHVVGGSTLFQFGEMWAYSVMAGQKSPVRIMEGQLRGPDVDPHRRFGTLDGFFWLFVNGEYQIERSTLSGEFVEIFFDEDVDTETTDVPGPPAGLVRAPTSFVPASSVATGTQISSNIALAALATNFTPSAVTAGVKTSLALSLPAKEGSYRDGDEIFLLDPEKGKIESLTVTTTNAAGATSLAVSGTLQNAYPKGAYVLYNILNKYTTSGSTTSDLSGLGAAGQIAYWNGASSLTGENGLTYNAATNTMTVGAGGQGRVIIDQGTSWSQAITAGSLEFGSYNTNNCWFGDNMFFGPSGWTYRNSGPASLFYFLSGGFQYRTAPSGTGGTSAPQTTHIWVTNTGDVGIGDVPARKFHVTGQARITGSAGTPTALMGRAANGDIANLTLGSGLSISSGTLSATATGTIGGTIAAARVAYGSGTDTITGEADFTYDAPNNRLTVGTTGGTGTYNARYGAASVVEPFKAEGNISVNMVAALINSFNAGGAGNVIWQLITGGANGGDPAIQFGVSGVVSHAIGLDNSDGDRFKITPNASLPGENANASFVVTNDVTPRYGFNVDAPAYVIDMNERARFGQVMSRPATYAAPTPGTGAGTGPTFTITNGTGNGFIINITTGTSPTLNGNIVTITIPWFSSGAVNATFSAYNDLAASHISRFKVGSTSNNNITLTNCNTALSASSGYSLMVVFFG